MFSREKKYSFLLMVLLVFSLSFLALAQDSGVTAKFSGMAGSFTAMVGDVNNIYTNPAGLAFLNGGVAAFSTNDHLGLGLDYTDLAVVKEYKTGGFGLGAKVLNAKAAGIPLVQREVTLAYGQRLPLDLPNNLQLALGANLTSQNGRLDGEQAQGNISSFALNLGSIMQWDKIRLGFMVQNIVANYKSDLTLDDKPYVTTTSLDKKMQFGLAYDLNSKTVLTFGGQKDDNLLLTLGAERNLFDNLVIRGGLSNTGKVTAGMGFSKGPWNIDFSYEIHQVLGETSKISAGVSF